MAITLRQMRSALALAEIGHFSKAAERCHITQSALSQQIRQLEDACGTRLFSRSERQVRPTPFGREFLARAERVVVEADRLESFAQDLSGQPARAVRFGLIPTVAPYLLPEIYPALRTEWPEMKFLISENRTERLLDHLEEGTLDIVLTATDLPDDTHGELVEARLFSDPFVLACAASHKMAEPVRLDLLSPDDILLLDEGHCLRDQALDACGLATNSSEKAFAATSLSTIVEFVANGQGVTLLPTISLKKEASDMRIRIHELAPPGASRDLRLVWHSATPYAAFFAGMTKIIQTAAQSLVCVPIMAEG